MELSNKIVNLSNELLKNSYVRTVLLLVTGVFMGYTLQPVPIWLNNLFNVSHILKFFVLFIAGCIAVYPVNQQSIMYVFVGSILTLLLFQFCRYLDKK